jgi:hypothetical protein
MLKRLSQCVHCGAEMQSVRSTKSYCSDACRKKVARGKTDLQQSRWLVECLRRMRLVAKIWPIYSWEQSPPIFALMATAQAALDELNLDGIAVTEGELGRALRDCGIETTHAGERLKVEIRMFYDGRKDRRIKKGYTPSDNGNSAL